MYDFPTSTEMERIRSNVNTLKQAYFSFTQVPESLDYMTWQKANDIEKILFEIEKTLMDMENNFIYCGVAGCGQDRIWQQRFRRPKNWISQPYKLSQYMITDKINIIATNSNKEILSHTFILCLAQLDKRDGVYESVQAINASMNILDGLVGVDDV